MESRGTHGNVPFMFIELEADRQPTLCTLIMISCHVQVESGWATAKKFSSKAIYIIFPGCCQKREKYI